MVIFDEARMYARFATGLRSYLKSTLTLGQARSIVLDRLARRSEAFLAILERGVYGHRASPYLPLLEAAGCELGDIRSMVLADGVEPTLERLAEEGVYVTFEEFKGRRPIERGGRTIQAAEVDFTNPFLTPAYQVETGGSTGARRRVSTDLDHLAAQAPQLMLGRHAHGVLGAPIAVWREPLPAPTGIGTILRAAKCGQIPQRWFSPLTDDEVRAPIKHRLANAAIVYLGRAFGTAIPHPEPLPLGRAIELARWAKSTAVDAGCCVIGTTVSLSVRVCLAAREEGLDLDGVVFAGGSEPPTPAKVRTILASGARWMPGYFSVEAGAIGLGCATPRDGNDLHFMRDSLALIQRRRQVFDPTAPSSIRRQAPEVDAFCFTTLLPSASKILLNVESDDFGVIETHDCGCALGEVGYRQHLRHVRSFGKLTGEGVTLVASAMERLLDEVLPARFGGSALDYQLLEEEDDRTLSRLSLLISPEVEIEDEAAVIEALLDGLSRHGAAAELAQALWRQAETLRVRRQQPHWNTRGKLAPLHSRPRADH